MTGLWFRQALLPEGWTASVRVAISGGRLATVEPGAPPRAGDQRHAIGLPGLPNLHSHAFQRAMAGRAERRVAGADDFWLWRERMYQLAQAVQPEDLRAIAALAYAEMLQAGFVRVGEFHYLHNAPDGRPYADPGEMAISLAAAAADSGIALTLLPVFYAHSGFGAAAPTDGQARFVNSLDGYGRLLEGSGRAISGLEGAVLGVAPHSLRAVTPEHLAELTRLLPAAPVHIHVAEQTREVEDCFAWSGRRPVDWLLAHAQIDRRWCLVHATHMDAAETLALAASGAIAGLCPITEANLGDGIFPAEPFLAAGGQIGVGSDANVRIDATEELRLLEYGQRLTQRRRNVLAESADEPTADRLYRAALAGGGQALGCDPPALRPGAPASFISLDAEHPALADAPPDEYLSRWIFAAGRAAVDGVWVGGRQLVAEGRHLRWTQIVSDYRAAIGRLRADSA
ncbi:formimidoylglutamate deiminase [Phenylobacterium sp. LjRoot225]|uniref:formimidoylglutamate deiminase n=1 Tax=Phenylobacterium sp. LjRoot225 TaxID=3342285 RepID=UPI003ECF4313